MTFTNLLLKQNEEYYGEGQRKQSEESQSSKHCSCDLKKHGDVNTNSAQGLHEQDQIHVAQENGDRSYLPGYSRIPL